MHLCSRLPLEMRHIQRKLSSFPVGHSFIIQFKPGNSLCAVDYVNATATQIEKGVWNVTTESGASETYPSEEEIEQFHELFSEYGEEGYWAALTQSDATSFFGPPEERARSLAGANADEPNASEVSTECLNGYAWAFGGVRVSCGMINEVHL